MINSTLPNYTTPFVGRSKELLEIKNRLQDQDCRLLTLVGPGGIGKTRLAAHYATNNADEFTDGTIFVNLQAIQDSEQMVMLLAESLDFQFHEYDDTKQQIQDYLRDKNMLVIMDNYEQLLPNIEFVSNLVQNTHSLKLLITSREPVNIREEWLYYVKGLMTPQDQSDFVAGYDAVQLFAIRALQFKQVFNIDREFADVARICHLVEGMPLAIELAAAWLKSLSCKAIGDQIEHNLDFLVSSIRNVPERHQSIRVVFDYSWSMLSKEEQAAFMKLSVFRGGFKLNAAETIVDANPFILLGLVEKSFIRSTESDRYQIHELMRQYGLEKLESSGLQSSTIDRHSKYFLQLLKKNTEKIKGASQTVALDEIEADYANIRSAWEYAVAQNTYEGVERGVECFYWFCVFRGYFQEGINLLELTITDSVPPSCWSKIRVRQIGLMAHITVEDNSDWRDDLEQCLKISRNDQDISNIGFCLTILGLKELILGNFVQSRTYYQRSLEEYKDLENDFYIARILRQIGYVHLTDGNFEDAEAPLRESLERARQCGDKVTEANCLYNLGSVAGFRNDFDGWFSGYEAALRIRRELNDRASIALNLGGLALGFFCGGDLNRANVYASEALSIASEINHRESRGQAFIWLAYIDCIREDYEQSQKRFENSIRLVPENNKSSWVLLGQALLACAGNNYRIARTLLESALSKMPLFGSFYNPIAISIWALILIDEDKVPKGISTSSYVIHHPSNFGKFLEKWNWFTRLIENLKNNLGEKQFAEAWEHGKTLVIEDIVDELKVDILSSQSKHQNDLVKETMMAANNSLDEPLTDREHEILILIAQGLSNQEIADQLYIARSTVKRHINNCYGKLGVSSRTKAIVVAQKLKLVDSTPPLD